MSMDDTTPCPFCGGKVPQMHMRTAYGKDEIFMRCLCGAQGPIAETEHIAGQKWDARRTLSAHGERISGRANLLSEAHDRLIRASDEIVEARELTIPTVETDKQDMVIMLLEVARNILLSL